MMLTCSYGWTTGREKLGAVLYLAHDIVVCIRMGSLSEVQDLVLQVLAVKKFSL